jgi:hypothetical protein
MCVGSSKVMRASRAWNESGASANLGITGGMRGAMALASWDILKRHSQVVLSKQTCRAASVTALEGLVKTFVPARERPVRRYRDRAHPPSRVLLVQHRAKNHSKISAKIVLTMQPIPRLVNVITRNLTNALTSLNRFQRRTCMQNVTLRKNTKCHLFVICRQLYRRVAYIMVSHKDVSKIGMGKIVQNHSV